MITTVIFFGKLACIGGGIAALEYYSSKIPNEFIGKVVKFGVIMATVAFGYEPITDILKEGIRLRIW